MKRIEEFKKFYESIEWRRERKIRLAYDNYLCQECMKKEKNVPANTVHHIVELEKDYSKRLDFDNLESLCRYCHEKKHARVSSLQLFMEEWNQT